MTRCVSLFVLLVLSLNFSQAQEEDLLRELEASQSPQTEYAVLTFKGTRVVNGHSVENKLKGDLEFIFAHRFGPINSGISELFGLDDAYVRLGLDYGITQRLSASVGRNSVDKTLDGYLKYRIARQQTGVRELPFTVTALAGTAYRPFPELEDAPAGFRRIDRLAYIGQLLIARKFNPVLSLQIMPTVVHKNAADQMRENNDQFALGVGGRAKLTKSVALTGEYYYRIAVPTTNPYHNTLGFGVDIETGGHVFQLVFTNTRGLTERAFITETEGSFSDGDIHFGFNVTRTFRMERKK